MKRMISLLLAFAMVIGMLPMTAWAAELEETELQAQEMSADNSCGDDLTWAFDEATGTLTISGSGEMDDYGSKPTPWEDYSSVIKTVHFEEGIAYIGENAFHLYDSIISVLLPDSLEKIGLQAFYGCTRLESITIPDSVMSIGNGVFGNCDSLTSVIIPGSVRNLGSGAFIYCDNLSVATIEEGVINIGAQAFRYCSSLERVDIPTTVSSIGSNAFDGCTSLKSVVIPDGVTVIEYQLFNDCSSLKSVTIPDSVESIGYHAFSDCTSLTDIFYEGSEEKWTAITVDTGNEFLTNVTIHFDIEDDDSGNTTQPTTPCEHSYTAEEFPPTCEEQGYTVYTCDRCGHSFVDDYVEAHGHSFGEWYETKAPTVESEGEEQRDCKYCGLTETRATEKIETEPHKHNYIAEVTAPTCTEQGYTTYTCKCGDSYVGDYVAAHGHDFGEWYETKAPTVDVEGEERQNCANCDAYNIRATEKLPAENGAEEVIGGACGDNLTWSLSDGVLTIVGHGPMKYDGLRAPWYDYKDKIVTVIIEENVTSIGSYAFTDSTNLTHVIIPESVISVGSAVFDGCKKLASAGPIGGDYDIEFGWIDIIPANAFHACEELVSVTIPEGITGIGAGAFKGCTSLTSMVIPDGVVSIGQYVFENCTSLSHVIIPGTVTSMGNNGLISGDGVFVGCNNLTSAGPTGGDYDIEFGWTDAIPANAFDTCERLVSVTIPEGMTGIGIWAFSDCTSLTSVVIPYGVTSIDHYAFRNCISLSHVVISNTVVSIGSSVFTGCNNLTSAGPVGGNYSIEYGWQDEIPAQAFSGCESLTSVIIPNGVASIGTYAFMDCSSLSHLIIPSTVESIGSDVFTGCNNLTSAGPVGGSYSIELGWTEKIPKRAFSGCTSLNSVIIPDGVVSIDTYAFMNCTGLSHVIIPNTVMSMGSDVFAGCKNLTSAGPIGGDYNIEFEWTDIIPQSAFNQCNYLTSVTIPASITSIGEGIFAGCSNLVSAGPIGGDYNIEFGWTETIPADAFSYCDQLINVTIPESITSIGESAFDRCSNLINITIPENVISIGDNAFFGCTSLTNVIISKGVTNIGRYAFGSCTGLTNVIIPEGVTSIGYNAFMNCTSLSYVTIPNSLTSIEYSGPDGGSAFVGCSKLTSAGPIGGGYNIEFGWVDTIPSHAFHGCKSLKSITIPEGVTQIEECAFYNCSSLLHVNIPDCVTTIGGYAFKGCDTLTSVTIPESVTKIGQNAFEACTNLSCVIILGKVTSMGISIFADCNNLISAGPIGGEYNIEYIWSDAIPAYAFYNSKDLASVTIPASTTQIGNYAFFNCDNLSKVVFEGTKEQWSKIIIGDKNECLTNATIHFISSGPDSGDTVVSSVRCLSSWDRESGTVFFGMFDIIGALITDETDKSFLDNINELIGQYVLVSSRPVRDPENPHRAYPDVLLSMYPVETREDTVTAIARDSITFGDQTYTVASNVNLSGIAVGDTIQYHVYNGKVVGIGGESENRNPAGNDYEIENGTSSTVVGDNCLELSCDLLGSDPYNLEVTLANKQADAFKTLSDNAKQACTVSDITVEITLPSSLKFASDGSRVRTFTEETLALGENTSYVESISVSATGYVPVHLVLLVDGSTVRETEIGILIPEKQTVTVTPGSNSNQTNQDMAERAEKVELKGGSYGELKVTPNQSVSVSPRQTVSIDTLTVEGDMEIGAENVLNVKKLIIREEGHLYVRGELNVEASLEMKSDYPQMTVVGTVNAPNAKVNVKDGRMFIYDGTFIAGTFEISNDSYVEQSGGNLIIKNQMEVSSEETSIFTEGTLWLEGDFKQSWHNSNFQASGEHVTVKLNAWDKDNISFATFANDDVYFNHLYIEESIAEEFPSYDLTEFAKEHIKGAFCKTTVDRANYTYKVVKDSDLDPQYAFEKAMQELFGQEIEIALENSQIKSVLSSDEYMVFERSVTTWLIILQTELIQDKVDKTKVEWNYIELSFDDAHIVVCMDSLYVGAQGFSALYWYGNLGQMSYTKDDMQVLGLATSTNTGKFYNQAIKKLTTPVLKKCCTMFAISTAAKFGELIKEFVQFSVDCFKFSQNIDKVNEKIQMRCDVLSSYNDLPDIAVKKRNTSISQNVVANNELVFSAPAIIKTTSDIVTYDNKLSNDISGSDEAIEFGDTILRTILLSSLGKGSNEEISYADAQHVTALNLSNYQLYSLTGLEAFSNLKSLNLSGNNFYDLTPIAGLTQLERLDISKNRIMDLTPIANLTNLTELSIANNLITDLSILENLDSLSKLELQYNPIENADSIGSLAALSQLNISGIDLPDGLGCLSSLEKLTVLIADDCGLHTLDGLKGTSLEYLSIRDNVLSTLGELDCRNLLWADMEGNQLTDITALESAGNLRNLRLSGNNLNDGAMRSLAKATALEILDISANQITSLDFTKEQSSLQQLDASANPLTNLSGLANNKNLRVLKLESCKLQDASVQTMTGLTGLEYLHLRHNNLTDASFLAQMPALVSVDLSQNFIVKETVPSDIVDIVDISIAAKSVKTLDLAVENETVEVGSEIRVSCYVYPALSENVDLVWSSSDKSIAKVSGYGIVSTISEGTVVITATSANGRSAQIQLTVVEKQQCTHTYDEPAFAWNEYSSCEAMFACLNCEYSQTIACVITSSTTPATETEDGEIVYTATVEFNGQTYTDTKTEIIPATGHITHLAGTEWNSDSTNHWHTCTVCEEIMDLAAHSGGTATCTDAAICSTCGASYGTTDSTNHSGGTEIRNAKDPTESEKGYTGDTYCLGCGGLISAGITIPALTAVKRVAGTSRADTALEVADALKEALGGEKFDTIILANGEDKNFADALTGSYLATVRKAPILMYRTSGLSPATKAYIQNNLVSGGTVYLLGGELAIPADVETELSAAGYEVLRLAGGSRFDTNLAILEEAGVGSKEILIARGFEFADSLSASATGLPILMVNEVTGKLTDSQISFLKGLKGNKLTILGGTVAISETLQATIEGVVGREVDRVAGGSREATSVEIAKRYFDAPDFAVAAYSRRCPDGLCGGPLAYAMGAPLLLVNEGQERYANAYITEKEITSGYVLGGTLVITDKTARAVFGLAEDVVIEMK